MPSRGFIKLSDRYQSSSCKYRHYIIYNQCKKVVKVTIKDAIVYNKQESYDCGQKEKSYPCPVPSLLLLSFFHSSFFLGFMIVNISFIPCFPCLLRTIALLLLLFLDHFPFSVTILSWFYLFTHLLFYCPMIFGEKGGRGSLINRKLKSK